MLPTEVLEASAKALVDYQGKGFGIAECSHRGKEFDGVLDEAIAVLQALLVDPRHARRPVPAGRGDAAVHHHPDELPQRHRPTTWSAASGGRRPPSRRRAPTARRSTSSPRSESEQLRSPADRLDGRSERRLPPRLLERDRARPPPGRVAEAPEPDRRRQHRVHVAPAPDRAHRAGLRRRAEEPGPRRRGAGDRAQGSLRAHRQERAQDLELQGPGRDQELPQHAADVRHLHPARDLPLAGERRAAWRRWRSATPRRPS